MSAQTIGTRAWLLLLLALASCRAPVSGSDPVAGSDVPAAYTLARAEGEGMPQRWWTVFQNPELDALVTAALNGNLDLAQSAARLRQAAAVAEQARAGRLPDLSWSGQAARSRRRAAGDTGVTSSESYGLGLAASYEVDLWGRVQAVANSALLAADASHSDLETAAMTLAAEVADRWLRLVEAQSRVRLLRNQVETGRRILDLLKLRTIKAGTPILDVYQQEQAVLAAEALLPEAELQAELLPNELAFLTGQPVGAVGAAATPTLPELPPLPETGLPADLLLQRPDLRAHWLRLETAAWNVAAARAARLPALRLTGTLGYDSDALSSLFSDWLANLAAGVAGPIFDGGRRRAEVRRTRAVREERLAAYRQAVLRAVLEADQAILSERRLAEQLAATRLQIESAARTVEESRRRYTKGAIDYLPVLAAQHALEQLQRHELAAHRALLSNRVALYRALGGRWAGEAVKPLADSVAEDGKPKP